MADPPSMYACLGVYGSFEPDDLSSLLGVSAKTGRATDARPDGKQAGYDSWHWSTEKAATWNWPDHLDSVLQIVRPHAADFTQFCDSRGLERQVHLIAETTTESPDGSFSAEQIAEIASLGCSLEVDLHPSVEDHTQSIA